MCNMLPYASLLCVRLGFSTPLHAHASRPVLAHLWLVPSTGYQSHTLTRPDIIRLCANESRQVLSTATSQAALQWSTPDPSIMLCHDKFCLTIQVQLSRSCDVPSCLSLSKSYWCTHSIQSCTCGICQACFPACLIHLHLTFWTVQDQQVQKLHNNLQRNQICLPQESADLPSHLTISPLYKSLHLRSAACINSVPISCERDEASACDLQRIGRAGDMTAPDADSAPTLAASKACPSKRP